MNKWACLLCLAGLLAHAARADVVEFAAGGKREGRILGFFNQRFEFADKEGQITHPSWQEVTHIQFDSVPATIITRDRKTFHGRLVTFENGAITIAKSNGTQLQFALDRVQDLTVTGKAGGAPAAPPPPPAKPAPPPTVAAAAATPARPAAGLASPQPGKVTIVDFYADWCGPCKMMGPILEDITRNDPEVVVRKVNVDDHADLVQRYNVRGIPHMMVYDKAGREVAIIIGANPRAVQQAVAKAKSAG